MNETSEKLKLFAEELKIIQDTIKRMADNSFKLKNWSIAVVVVAFIFRAKVDSILICLVPLVAFGYLDSYYLALERSFRKLYNEKVDNFKQNNFNNLFVLNADKVGLCEIFRAFKSLSISVFYVGIGILILIAHCFKG